MELNEIKSLRIGLASSEKIRSWSYGEVTKPETINYRRLRPEKDGLFCEAIFGPTKDWQCYCGKYKNIRFRGIVCDKCGVEVTHSRVRRERMGHIDLAAPVAHLWYTRRSPTYLGLLLNISQRKLDRVLYFAKYIVTNVDEEARERALHHLEEEANREVGRLHKEYQEFLEALEKGLHDHASDVDLREQEVHEEVARCRDEATEEVMSAATQLRELIDQQEGSVAEEDIVLGPNETLIVPAGEVISRDHRAELNQLVQDELTEIEKRYAAEESGLLEPLTQERDQASLEAESHKETAHAELEEKLEEIQEKLESDREELMSIKERMRLNEAEYRELKSKWGRVFGAGMGAEAIRDIVARIDLEEMAGELRVEIRTTRSKQRRKKAIKRLKVVEALRASGNRPEWMILEVLPVIPPALRPMVQLDGGRFATSDLNDLYRRVINRNNRLKHLLELQAPEVIIRNEKRMLQEAVDSLIDNSRRGKAVSLRGRRQLKSLSDMLKGKQGRFRRNLLGKRVDYSGRSVIVVGPQLRMDQCGLPKRMALELFRPFVMHKLVEYDYAINVKGAKRLIEKETPEVWEVLEEVIKTRPVLLNRAPTLHRLGILAFEPILVEGSAIHLHPLVCSGFNADFDGDQMAVHVPLSEAAVKEARELMLATRNLLRPANGQPEVAPTKDMVLGCFYLTMEVPEEEQDDVQRKAFSSYEEVEMAYQLGSVRVHTPIKFYWEGNDTEEARFIDTTVGRVLFNAALPPEVRFVNRQLDKGGIKDLVSEIYMRVGTEGTAEAMDPLKDIGFEYAMRSGTTIAIDDIHVPPEKERILEETNRSVAEMERQYQRGLITENERYTKTVDLWTEATEEVTEAVARELDPYSSLGIMVNSGSTKGGLQPIRQLAGMRGLIADPSGRIIALPIQSNFREGLTALEYFISTHGARKGLADTALRTADAGYLTRRLVDVSQGVIIDAEDCGTTEGIWITREASDEMGETLGERIVGRFTARPIVDPESGEVILDANEYVDQELAQEIEKSSIERVYVRSPLTCKQRHGLCVHCYGEDLARSQIVKLGAAVGTVAAQSIGEPGTQLTLRTFHSGGVAGASDITQGLPRVQELFEARNPKGQAVVAKHSGEVHIHTEGDQRQVRVTSSAIQRVPHAIPGNYDLVIGDGDRVQKGELLASYDGEEEEEILAKASGRISVDDGQVTVIHEESRQREYEIPMTARLRVKEGQQIEAGDMITEGSKNPHEILSILGIEAVRDYMIAEIQKVYRSQGVIINDKHIEAVVRQMLRRVRITDGGDTEYLPGELADRIDFETSNEKILEEGGQPASGKPVILGITKAALNTDSFLSAASFQHTIKVLAQAAVEGAEDELRGLKESVLIGKLIPAGTGFRARTEEEPEAGETELDLEGLDEDVLEGLEEGEPAPEKELDALDAIYLAKGGNSMPAVPLRDSSSEG